MNWPKNPFVITEPVTNSHHFLDRKLELDVLIESAADPAVHLVLLEGARRVGKTSILKRFQSVAPSDPVAVFLDIRTLSRNVTRKEITSQLLTTLGEKLSGRLGGHLTAAIADDSHSFRREFLPRVLSDAGQRRVLVLIDETELLQEADPEIVEDLLEAFRTDVSLGPLLVLSWGRPLGVLPSTELMAHLRASKTIPIGRFPEDVTRSVPDNARAYSFSSEARDAMYAITAGHPYYVAALNHVIFERRVSAQNTAVVEPDEVLNAIRPAHEAIGKGLHHAWADHLSSAQSLLGRAIAEITGTQATPAGAICVGRATIAEVAEKLLAEGYRQNLNELRAAVHGLEANEVLDHRGEHYGFVAPFLGYWLRAQPYDTLLRGPKGEARKHLQNARTALEIGNRRAALRECDEALRFDPRETEACIIAADLEAETGNFDRAIELLKTAAAVEPQTVSARLQQLLTERIKRAAAAGEDPRSWYGELVELNSDARRTEDISDLICDYYLRLWANEIQLGNIERAYTVLEELSRENIRDWRRRAAERYVAVQQRNLGSEERLHRGLAAVRDAFTLITEEPLDDEARVDGDTLQRIMSSGGSEGEILERVRRQLASGRAPAAWSITIEVLDKGFRYGLDRDESEIPMTVLHDLAFRAPASTREALLDCYRRHLPVRILQFLRRAPEQALSAVRLLTAFVEHADLDPILGVLDENALELGVGNDDRIVKFFQHGAAIYWVLLDAAKPADLSKIAERVAGQLPFVVDRMKRRYDDDTADWSLFLRAWSGVQMWQNVLARPELASISRTETLRQQLMPPAEVMREGAVATLGDSKAWAVDVSEKLAKMFESMEELPMDLPGMPRSLVKTYRATWRGEPVNVKVYRLVSNNPALRRFLMGLWENERRVLFDVATRRQGRALTRLKFAQWRDSDDHRDDHLVVVTEPVGPLTLRTWLDRAYSINTMTRGEVWETINAIVEGVAALHEARYLHRTIRPESFFLKDGTLRGEVKLGNFEWSIYVHSITDRSSNDYPNPRTFFDRYSAPEMLRGRFQDHVDATGENFGSDIYSLGLVLFELLVRPLKPYELEFYPAQTYDYAAHCEWIERLRDEVRRTVTDIDERLLLLEMLSPDVRVRMSELTDAVELSRRFAHGARAVQRLMNDPAQSPRFTTTLHRGTPECIDNFLQPYVANEELGGTNESLRQYLQRALSGARIYRNGGNPARPLVIEGAVTFTVMPFEHLGTKYSAIPYLLVGTSDDFSIGPELARLPRDVEVDNLQAGRARIETQIAETLRHGEVWRQLFEIAASTTDRLPLTQREFHSILRVTAEVERALWDTHVVPFKRVWQNDERTEALIEMSDAARRRERLTLSEFIAQQIDHQQMTFELGSSNNAIAPFDDQRIWTVSSVEGSRVRLHKLPPGDEIPAVGFLRPDSLRGNRSIYRRRQDLLRHLEDDVYLLTAVTEPEKLRTDSIDHVHPFFNRHLDDDKARIVERVIRTRPLFAVQGPPGTGKTTLAAEVIEQTLANNPSARILVASQAHEPLNNLLKRVDNALRERTSTIKPIAVRILTDEKRIKVRESDKDIERFHPSAVAEDSLANARKWHPQGESCIDEALLQEWRVLLSSEAQHLSSSIAERIVGSANIVYVTANDRSINTLHDDQTFDLLIFEEAAKAYPLEVLAPMRLARRWLLIGDHDQLPPFDIESFQEQLVPHVHVAMQKQRELRGGARKWGGTRLDHLFLGDTAHENALAMSDFFEWLHGKGIAGQFADRLTYQWRMHPDIRRLLQSTYYPSLQDGDEKQLRAMRRHRVLKPEAVRKSVLVWIDVPPITDELPLRDSSSLGHVRIPAGALSAERRASGGGYWNPYERAVIHELMRRIQLKGHGGFARDIVFLSPYRGQVQKINKMFENWDSQRNPHTGDLRGRAFTVDSFQGRQVDVVVVSLVRNNLNRDPSAAFGFLDSVNRAGVMFSRAESLLVIIGCSAHFAKLPSFHINKVYEHIQQYGAVIPAAEFLDARNYDLIASIGMEDRVEAV